MNRRRFAALMAGLPALTAMPSDAVRADSSVSSPRRAKAFKHASQACQKLLNPSVPNQRIVGLSVAAAVGDHIEYSECVGFANLEWQLPVSRTTRFRIGSISKLLTSIGMGILMERGKLELDVPITRYVSYPEVGRKITVRQLASHTSGLPHYGDGLAEDAGAAPGADRTYWGDDLVYRYPSLTAAMEKYQHRPLLFEPGTRFHYSSFGWNLIGAIIEQVTGQLFVDFMREQVFVPLGMGNTIEDDSQRVISQRTGFYTTQSDGSFVNSQHVEQSDLYAGGGYLSTPEDLVKLGLALRAGRPISAATWAELRVPGPIQDAESDVRYGLGWANTLRAGHSVTGHGGSHSGCRAQLEMTTDSAVPVILAVTINTSSDTRARRLIAESILKGVLS